MEHEKLLLGEILIQRKLITKEQLDTALGIQKQENGFVGEILGRLGYVDEKDVVVALVLQHGLPYIAVNKYKIEPEIVQLIPHDVALKYKVIAFDRIGDVLSVVMINPMLPEQRHLLESITQCKIATFISTKTEIEQAISRNY